MKQSTQGRIQRQGISLRKLFRKFPDDVTAERWFASQRWPRSVACIECGSTRVQAGAAHKSMHYRCREYKVCGKRFSARTGTVMHDSKLGYQVWAIAIYLFTTNIEGVSSMKLHRDLGITKKSAWHLAQRLREIYTVTTDLGPFVGPVVRLKPTSYQPSKAELEEPVTFPEGVTPEALARSAGTPVEIVYEDE